MSKRPTFRGAILWSYIMNGGQQGISAGVTFVLASVLGPRDFGTVAMAMAYIMLISMFLDQGFCLALIQRRDLKLEHLDSVFWMLMVFGLGLMILSLGFSGWWSRVNHLPALAAVISWLSLTILIGAFGSVQRAILMRDLDFKVLSLQSNLGAAVGGVVGIGMALSGYGVWALVGQKLSESTVALVIVWKISRWRPRLQFSFLHLKELFRFAFSTFGAKAGVYVNRYVTAILMGLFFGPVTVGLYRLAEKVVEIVLDITTTPLRFAAFPQFSRFQDNPVQLRKSMLSCLRLGATLTVPSLAGLAVTSHPLIAVMGAKWAPAANALIVLSALGIVLAFTRFYDILLPALSRPQHVAFLKWAESAVTVGLLVAVALVLKGAPVSRQVVGLASARFAVGVLLFGPILVYFILHLSGISFRAFIAVITPSFCSAGATVGTVVGLSESGLLGGFKPVGVLSAEVMAGALVAAAVLWLTDRQLKDEIVAYTSNLSRGGAIGRGTLSSDVRVGSAETSIETQTYRRAHKTGPGTPATVPADPCKS